MELTKNELLKFKTLLLNENTHNNNGFIYIKGNYIYKLFHQADYFQKETERNIEYQISNHFINTPKIHDKIIINNEFSGYIMDYIPNSITFRSAIKKNKSH